MTNSFQINKMGKEGHFGLTRFGIILEGIRRIGRWFDGRSIFREKAL